MNNYINNLTDINFGFILFSPLEQFVIQPLDISIGPWYMTATNQLVTLFIVTLFLIVTLLGVLFPKNFSVKVLSTKSEIVFTWIFNFVEKILLDSIKHKNKYQFMPYIFTIFTLTFVSNVLGLTPYSFALTGQLAFALTLALNTFILCIIIGFKEHGILFFQRFFPGNLHVALGPLLVPIEIISFFFQPVSLAVRLFANIMSGHILMFVFAGFIYVLSLLAGLLGMAWVIPYLILIPLCVLEIAVACIQAYVFTLLTCLYINDALNLH